jgi:hypothetical protein
LSYRVYVRSAAERDIVEAQNWYEAQQQGLAAEFHAEFSAMLGSLAETPLIYPLLYREARYCIDSPAWSGIASRIQTSRLSLVHMSGWPRQDIRTVAWKVIPGNMPDGGDSQALRRPLYDGE